MGVEGDAYGAGHLISWSGGIFGAIYIGIAILLIPRLGAAMDRDRTDARLAGFRPFWTVWYSVPSRTLLG
jgi:hypothetical protein